MFHPILFFTRSENIGGWVMTVITVAIFGFIFKNPNRDRTKKK